MAKYQAYQKPQDQLFAITFPFLCCNNTYCIWLVKSCTGIGWFASTSGSISLLSPPPYSSSFWVSLRNVASLLNTSHWRHTNSSRKKSAENWIQKLHWEVHIEIYSWKKKNILEFKTSKLAEDNTLIFNFLANSIWCTMLNSSRERKTEIISDFIFSFLQHSL